MYATDYLEKNFLNIMNGITFTAPQNIYIGLFLSNPGEIGTGVEVNYVGYERMAITFSAPSEMNGGIGITNDSLITFATSAIDAGTVTHIGLLDSKVGGNILAYGKLTENLDVLAGEAPVLLAGEVSYYLLGNLSKAYKTKLLNIFRKTNLVGITPHFALFNGSPEQGGAELSGSNYERVALTFSTPSPGNSGQMYIQNSEGTTFNRPSEAWGTWSYSAIYDAKSQGEPVWIQEKVPSKAIKKGYMPVIALNAIKLAIN